VDWTTLYSGTSPIADAKRHITRRPVRQFASPMAALAMVEFSRTTVAQLRKDGRQASALLRSLKRSGISGGAENSFEAASMARSVGASDGLDGFRGDERIHVSGSGENRLELLDSAPKVVVGESEHGLEN